MMLTKSTNDNIFQAHQYGMPPDHFPCFSRLFHERVHDSQLSQHIFLSFYDDDQSVHPRYRSSQFGGDVPYTATGKPKRLELKARLSEAFRNYRDESFKDFGGKG